MLEFSQVKPSGFVKDPLFSNAMSLVIRKSLLLLLTWNLDQGLEVIPPSMAMLLAKTSCRLVSSWCQPSGKVDDKLGGWGLQAG